MLGHRNCEYIELERLTEDDVAEYTALSLGSTARDVSHAVFARSEGNPFFMVELLRPYWRSAPPQADALALTGPALDIVRERLRTLSAETTALLSAAAVVGHDFDLGLLGYVSELDPQKTLDLLDAARETGTGNDVWYTDDFKTADEVVACAIAKLHIDTRHIYTAGGSAGALQATWMAYARSGYIAVSAPISGGLTGFGPTWLDPIDMPQDPTNVPSAIVSHGAPGSDVVILDFAVSSAGYEADIKKKGGLSVDCNNGGGHVGTAGIVGPAMWEFMKDHPFKVSPDPYANGVPSDFPKFCQIGPRLADGGAP